MECSSTEGDEAMRVIIMVMLGGCLLLTAAGCGQALCSDGCNGGSSTSYNDPIATATAVDFIYEGDFINYNNSESYFWSTILNDTFISFEGIEFYGVVRIRIYDDFKVLIFDEMFFGNGGTLQSKTISDLGISGLWEVQIDSTSVDGIVQVILD